MKGLLKALEAQRAELVLEVTGTTIAETIYSEWIEEMIYSEDNLVDNYLVENNINEDDIDDTFRDYQYETLQICLGIVKA